MHGNVKTKENSGRQAQQYGLCALTHVMNRDIH